MTSQNNDIKGLDKGKYKIKCQNYEAKEIVYLIILTFMS